MRIQKKHQESTDTAPPLDLVSFAHWSQRAHQALHASRTQCNDTYIQPLHAQPVVTLQSAGLSLVEHSYSFAGSDVAGGENMLRSIDRSIPSTRSVLSTLHVFLTSGTPGTGGHGNVAT